MLTSIKGETDSNTITVEYFGLSWWLSGKESPCQCRRHGGLRFNPWVRKIPWRRAWQPTPIFLPGRIPWTEEPGRLLSMGSQRVRHYWSNWACTQGTLTHTHTQIIIYLFPSCSASLKPKWYKHQQIFLLFTLKNFLNMTPKHHHAKSINKNTWLLLRERKHLVWIENNLILSLTVEKTWR